MSAVDLHRGSPGLAFPPLEQHIKAPAHQPISRIPAAPYNIFGQAELPSIEPKFLDLPSSHYPFLAPSPDPEHQQESEPQQPQQQLHKQSSDRERNSPIASGSPSHSPQGPSGLQEGPSSSFHYPQHLPPHQFEQQQQQRRHSLHPQSEQSYVEQTQLHLPLSSSAPKQSTKRKRSDVEDDDSEPPMLSVKQQRFVRPDDLYSTPGGLGSISFDNNMSSGSYYQTPSYPPSYSSRPAPPPPMAAPPSAAPQSPLPSGPRRVSAPETGPRSRQGSQVSGPTASPHALGAARFSEPPAHSYEGHYGGYSQQPVYAPYSGIDSFGGDPPYASSMPSQSQLGGLPSYSTYSSPGLHGHVSYPVGSRASHPGYPVSTSASDSTRQKPRCWDHGCNGREFSTFSNLLRHQREKDGRAAKSYCPRCGAEFTRSTAMSNHLQQAKCKPRPGAEG